MGSDAAAMANASVPAVSKDFAKKKRGNKSAKSQQGKLEQWPSQVKNKDENGHELSPPPLLPSPPMSFPRVGEKGFCDSDLGNTSSCGFYFRSSSNSEVDEGEGEQDMSLDNWEVVTDSLNPNNVQNEDCCGDGILNKPELNRAWRPDDEFRPQSLPNLSNQHSFLVNLERSSGNGAMEMGPCPICYEDLDLTDSSFLPCDCGFRLCLFCHKRILEADGRCPGCRKQYSPVADGDTGMTGGGLPLLPFRLSRSWSMSSRS